MGPASARITQVAAWPTSGPSSGKSPRISEETLPSSRGLTLKVSTALATLGLVIFLSASTCWVVSGTGGSSLSCGWLACRGDWLVLRLAGVDGSLPLFGDRRLD